MLCSRRDGHKYNFMKIDSKKILNIFAFKSKKQKILNYPIYFRAVDLKEFSAPQTLSNVYSVVQKKDFP